jgi:dienelactone hydrolase
LLTLVATGLLGATPLPGGALSPNAAAAAPADSPDGAWSVSTVDGGFQVTLHLTKQLDARDAVPELAVDGAPVGFAQQSPDGLTLTTVTTDPVAAHPSSVRLAWNGQVADATAAPATAPATKNPGHGGSTPTPDPTTNGPYGIARADYDFGDSALTLPGLGGRVAEERAAVWVPVGARGRRPVVLFLHGRHSACYNPTTRATDNAHWPCVSGFQPIPSFHGYDRSAEVLASRGYVVVSVSADGINAQDNPFSDDSGTLARGQLVLDHLDLLARADAGRAPGMSPLLRGRLDLTDVGLMGHSRGGEGVVKAALLNAARPYPYGIRAVLPLAPIDFGRETLPDVPMAVVLPYCDGDVSNQQGQHFYEDTRYAHPADDVLRASVLVTGADHNFFNTEWTPGVAVAPASDDWSSATDPTCGATSASTTRLTAAQQYQVGVAYIAGFFRLVLGHETGFTAMFEGTGPISVGAATVRLATQAPATRRLDIATLRGPAGNVSVAPAASGAYCASIANRSPQSGLPSCSLSTSTSRFPSFTPATYGGNVTASPMLHITWSTPTTVTATLPYGAGRYDALTVRAALDDANTPSDLTLTVVDGAGRRQSTTVSALGDALSVMPGTVTTLLPKTWLQTVRWPVAAMNRVNTRDIRRVLVSSATPTGGVYLSDIAFQSSAVGSGGPSRLPQVSIVGTTVAEGDGPGTATVHLELSRPSPVPVVADVQALAGTGTQVANGAQRVVIPPGRRTVAVSIPIVGNTTPAATVDTVYKVFVLDPVNAVVGQDFAHLTVHDDDPVPPPGG